MSNVSLQGAISAIQDAATKPLLEDIARLRKALIGLLCEMSLDYSLPSYDVYQVTKGEVDAARAALTQISAQ